MRVNPDVSELVRQRGFRFVVIQFVNEVTVNGDDERPGSTAHRFHRHHQRIVIDELDVHVLVNLQTGS